MSSASPSDPTQQQRSFPSVAPRASRFSSAGRTLKRLSRIGGYKLGRGDGISGNEADDGLYAGPSGIRVWYDSYTTIDWVHSEIKESSRLRRLKKINGVRGAAINAWDRLQSWLIVTLTGAITALIAGAIVESEAVLFDLKDGYCTTDWRKAKRFCCPRQMDQVEGESLMMSWSNSSLSSHTLGRTGLSSHVMAGWAAPVATSPRWAAMASVPEEVCTNWRRWADLLNTSGQTRLWIEYAVYIAIAILWSSIACLLTLKLTSSELYIPSRKSPATVSSSTAPGRTRENSFAVDTSGTGSTERTPLLGSSRLDSNGSNSQALKGFESMANEARAKFAIGSRKTLYFGAGSGISEVKCLLSGFVIHGYLGFWTLFVKSVGLAFSVASGLSLGKEGPFVHIASCVGNIVCRFFPNFEGNEVKKREILSCACAAGVAVAFGAPIGGILFSLEEVSYYFPAKVMFRAFFCALVAAAGLRLIDPFGTGKIVLFQVTYDTDFAFQELPAFVLLGLIGGLYGAFFTRCNMLWSKHIRAKSWMATNPLGEVMMITVLTVAVSFTNSYLSMGGPELITDLFSECHEHSSFDGLCISDASKIGPLISSIAWTMVAKGLFTIVTFGIKLPAGIFIPSLAVGACAGRIVGLVLQYIHWTRPDLAYFSWCPPASTNVSCIIPGVYGMVGAAAALSGVTRTTVSLAVIMFELTGTLTYAIPVMVSVLVARTVADALEPKGIYDLVIEFSGLPYLDPKSEFTWDGVSVQDAMDSGVEVVSLDQRNTVVSLRNKVERLASGLGYIDGGFPIVAKKGPSRATSIDDSQAPLRPAGLQMLAFIGARELEHGLELLIQQRPDEDPADIVCTFSCLNNALLEDESVDSESGRALRDSMTLSKLPAEDLSRYVDQAPITVFPDSPLELVNSYFVRLGVRYLVVVDVHGLLKGVIFKKKWLAFLASLEA